MMRLTAGHFISSASRGRSAAGCYCVPSLGEPTSLASGPFFDCTGSSSGTINTGGSSYPFRLSADAVRDQALGWLRAQVAKPKGRSGMPWSSPTALLVRVAMMEGLLADAWAVVNGHGCHEALLDELAEASEHSHPAQALKTYADRVERMVRLGGQTNYERAYNIIERMRGLREVQGETLQHAAYLNDLKGRHKAKRNFMKLLTPGDT